LVGVKLSRVVLLCILVGCAGFLAGRGGFRAKVSSDTTVDGNARPADRRDDRRTRGDARGQSNASASEDRTGIPAAARAVLSSGVDGVRIERWLEFLAKNMPQNAEAIAEFLEAEKREGRPYPVGTTLFWQAWAKVDAKGALSYLREHGENGQTEMSNLMKAWAYHDPAEAAKAFSGLDDSPLVMSALLGLSEGLVGSDPAAAVDFVARLSDRFQNIAALRIAECVVRESTIDEAQAWFNALSAKPAFFQAEAVVPLLGSMARRSEAGAVKEFVTQRLDESWTANPAVQAFAASMIAYNGGSPWEYVSKVMEKYPAPTNPLALASEVAGKDPEAALDWVNMNPDHHATDAILAATARIYLQRGKSEEAAALLDRIKDPALRDQAEAKQVVEKR